MIEFVHSCPVACEHEFVSMAAEILHHHRLRCQDSLPSPVVCIYAISVVRDGCDVWNPIHPCRLHQLHAVRSGIFLSVDNKSRITFWIVSYSNKSISCKRWVIQQSVPVACKILLHSAATAYVPHLGFRTHAPACVRHVFGPVNLSVLELQV